MADSSGFGARSPHRFPRRVSRRAFLGQAGLAALALAAGCRVSPPARREEEGASPLPPEAGELVIAQWPLYIDEGTIPAFEAETDIEVRYREVIADNQEFFATISAQLSEGAPTGWDLTALSDWVVAKMIRLGWLVPLDHSLLPNVRANMGEAFRDPPYDPGNAYSVPWQAGITGIGYNPKLTGRRITHFADLWDPAFAGHVGMLTEMVDTMNLTLLSLGIDPQEATVDDAHTLKVYAGAFHPLDHFRHHRRRDKRAVHSEKDNRDPFALQAPASVGTTTFPQGMVV
jgi:spermidine/putrescine transport system substrate-binding protein